MIVDAIVYIASEGIVLVILIGSVRILLGLIQNISNISVK